MDCTHVNTQSIALSDSLSEATDRGSVESASASHLHSYSNPYNWLVQQSEEETNTVRLLFCTTSTTHEESHATCRQRRTVEHKNTHTHATQTANDSDSCDS